MLLNKLLARQCGWRLVALLGVGVAGPVRAQWPAFNVVPLGVKSGLALRLPHAGAAA